MKKSLTLIPAALLSMSLLAGCGGAGKYAANTARPQYMEAAAETAAAAVSYDAMPAAAAYGYDDSYESDKGEMFYEGAAEEGADPASPVTLTSASGSPSSPVGRKLIRTVFMNVETDSFDDVVKQLQEKVAELGGYIERSDMSGSSMTDTYSRPSRYANITARIPSVKLDQFIVSVEGSGNVIYKSESTEDVTLQYSDLESKKKTLSLEQDRIWALLEKADTLEAVIALEERLSEIRYELESMESRLKLYDNQVEYSTVDITINEKTVIEFTPTAPESVGQRIKKGFTRNVNGVLETLTDFFIFLIASSPVWVPFGVIILLIALFTRKAVKKRMQKLPPTIVISGSEETKPKE